MAGVRFLHPTKLGEKMYVCALQKFSRSCADGDLLSKSPSGNIPSPHVPLRGNVPKVSGYAKVCGNAKFSRGHNKKPPEYIDQQISTLISYRMIISCL